MYRSSEPFVTPMFVFAPQIKTVKGSTKKYYPEQGELIYCSFKTFGGTEKIINDVLVVEDTVTVETWYRPDIKADCILQDVNGMKYEILGNPENISNRNQILKFKIRAIKGGA